MKVKITDIKRYEKDREGNPLKTKKGQPYTRLVIKTDKHDKPLSGFENLTTSRWEVGEEVDIQVVESGQYLNFKPLKEGQADMGQIEVRLKALEATVFGNQGEAPMPIDEDSPF